MPREAACLEEFPEQSVFPPAVPRGPHGGPPRRVRGAHSAEGPRVRPWLGARAVSPQARAWGSATRHTPRRAGCRRGRRGRGGAGPESRFAGATSRDASRNATRLKARATGRCAIGCAPVGKPVQQPDSHGDATCRALVGGCRPEAGTSRSPTGDVPSLSPGAAASPSPLAPLGPAFLPAPLLLCPGSARSQRLRDEVQGVT